MPFELIAVVHQMCGIMVEMNTAVMEAKRYRRKKKKRSRVVQCSTVRFFRAKVKTHEIM